MDVEKATLLSIGELKKTTKGAKLLNVVVKMPLGGEKKTFVIFENSNSKFDLIKLFENKFFKIGQLVSFNFNKAREDWQYDTIWAMKQRLDGEKTDPVTTSRKGE